MFYFPKTGSSFTNSHGAANHARHHYENIIDAYMDMHQMTEIPICQFCQKHPRRFINLREGFDLCCGNETCWKQKAIERREKVNINQANDRLKSANQEIRVLKHPAKGKGPIELSNGRTIDAENEKRRFIGELRNPKYLSRMDVLYSTNYAEGEELRKQFKYDSCSAAGKRAWELKGDQIKQAFKERTPWNKGTKGLIVSSCKGVNKHNSERMMRVSESRKGEGNPCYGRRMTQAEKDEISLRMRKKILDGSFTPNTNNRRTKPIYYKGIKFRSTWEILFYYHNPHIQFESVRIPYVFEGKERVYIPDFLDNENKRLVEIKPKELAFSEKEIAKHTAAREWCQNKRYSFEVITQYDLVNLKIPAGEFDESIEHKLIYMQERVRHETEKN